MPTMKAFVLDRYGGPSSASLRDVPAPTPAAGEVRIRVKAAGLNPVDYKIRAGKLKPVVRLALPSTLGCELSGVVDALGAGVTAFAVGDEVMARVGKESLGAFAEQCCVDASFVARKPTSVDFETSAALPLAGLTALQVLRDELRVGAGTRVFIPGGAGGVGTFAIQIARHLGAHVTTTASPRGEALVRRLGADEVVDYTKPFPSLAPFDGAFDLVGGEATNQCLDVVRRGGRIVSIAGTPEPRMASIDLKRGFPLTALLWAISIPVRLRAQRRGVDYRYVLMHPSGTELTELATLVDAGKLEIVIDRVLPFAEIADAFAYLEAGRAKGKVVVRM